eukprot:1890909-Heterocapsa_arctica.AAC.1
MTRILSTVKRSKLGKKQKTIQNNKKSIWQRIWQIMTLTHRNLVRKRNNNRNTLERSESMQR